MKIKISASVMCADLLNLKKDIQSLAEAGVDYLHWDIMDGVFVPSFSMNQDFMKETRKITNMPFDTHLMITRPENYIEMFAESGTDLMVVHMESTTHIHRVLQEIREMGLSAGVALNPDTPLSRLNYIIDDLDLILIMSVNPGFAGQKLIPSAFKKIEKTRELILQRGLNIDIQVDGNVSFENAVKMKECGANVFVAGSSSIFNGKTTILEGVEKLKAILID